MHKLKILDLFSGIGGFSYAAERLVGGYETIGFCEKDNFCKKVLRKHWKDVPIYDDIRRLDARKIKADVVVGGFPCQPVSQSGKREGAKDDRWLWDEMLRVIQDCKPRWIIGENVPGIVNIDDGDLFQKLCIDLENYNYEVQSFIVPACSQDAPHRRDRVWIVAYSDNPRYRTPQYDFERERQKGTDQGQEQSLFEFSRPSEDDVADTECLGWTERPKIRETSTGEQGISNNASNGSSAQSKNVSYSYSRHSDRQNQEILSRRYAVNTSDKRSNPESRRELELRMGNLVNGLPQELSGHFREEPEGVPRVATNQKERSQKLKALGNSIVPQVAAEFFKAIIIQERL